MNVVLFILPAVVAAVISFGLTPVARWLALRLGAVDRPGPRKVHEGNIPRLGGLAVVVAFIVVMLVLWKAGVPRLQRFSDELAIGMLLGLVPIFLISLRDDIKPLPALPKFLAQFLGAGIAIASGIHLEPSIHIFGSQLYIDGLAYVISLLWIVGVTNAFNLIDGLDGLSAGLALISAASLAGVSIVMGQLGLATVALVLAGALIGFLPYNLHPAKIFLGDTGSTAIGFFLACLALRGGSTLTSGMAILVPVVVLGIPVADTLVSMARRALRRAIEHDPTGLFDADRGHIHHRLLALGLDQRHAVLTLFGVGILLAAAGLGSIFLSHRAAAVLLVTMVIAAVVGVLRLGYDEFALLRRGGMLKVYDVPVLHRALFIAFVDLGFVIVAIYTAFVLKYDDWGLLANRVAAERMLALMPAVSIVIFFAFGLYRRTWRLASVEDLVLSSAAVVVATLSGALVSNFVFAQPPPLTWFLTFLLVLVALVNGSRSSYRLFRHWFEQSSLVGDNVVIYGAGMAGTLAIREVLSNAALRIRPVGFLDDDREKAGKYVNGYPVFGTLDALEQLIDDGKVQGLVVASSKISVEHLHEAAVICERRGIWLRHFRIGLDEEVASREGDDAAHHGALRTRA